MRRKTNFLKVVLIIVVLFLFLMVIKETSKISEIKINETNKTLTQTDTAVVSETETIVNETEEEKKEEKEEEETKIEQGQTKSYILNNKIINVTLEFVVKEYAIFIINGEKTDQLGLGQTHTTKQGITIAVLDIWVQDFEGGKREVDFLIG